MGRLILIDGTPFAIEHQSRHELTLKPLHSDGRLRFSQTEFIEPYVKGRLSFVGLGRPFDVNGVR